MGDDYAYFHKVHKIFASDPARRWLIRLKTRMLGLEYRYRDISAQEVFEKIYSEGVWGHDEDGNTTSGTGSHAENIVAPYIRSVSRMLSEMKDPVIVDLGCGDFNVGKNFLEYAKHYIACDISSIIIGRNRDKFDEPNLDFIQLNLAEDDFPRGDVVFVRQVLQHMSNDDIKRFVEKINRLKPCKYLVVTEHLPTEPRYRANIDKPTGPGTRVGINSGIDLAQEPFFLEYAKSSILLTVQETIGGTNSRIVTTIYEFSWS